MSELGKVCSHGSLARSCYICELEAERDRLSVELEEMHKARDFWEVKAEGLAEALKHMTLSGQLEVSWYKWKAQEALAEFEKGEAGKS